ncbi:MAG: M24 family metallopeptidase, partial [Chloroflexota bacterium]|nr:M24 family metallopeptidase [Chloroflexota bacterium]
KYQILADAMLAGMRAGKPGATVREVVEAINEVVTQAGYGKYCFPPYMRVRGHGLGLGSIEPGDLTLDNEKPLEAGMTFVLHPNQYVPETGYLMVGEPVVVAEEGLRPLTHRPPALDSIEV